MIKATRPLPPHKALLRSAVDLVLRLQGTKLPPYFHLRDRLSYLLHGLEPSLIRVAAGILRPGDTVVDIGANVGFLTREFATGVGRSGQVFAFEPDPATYECLAFNTQPMPQVTLSGTALSDRVGHMTLYLHPTSGMSNSLVNAWEGAHSIEVKTSTFDAWAAEAKPAAIRLVKIDVEGAEAHVLRGMEQTLSAETAPQIIMEFCPKNLGGPEVEREIFRRLSGHGYAVQLIDSAGGCHKVEGPEEVRGCLNENDYANLLCRREPA